MIILECGACGLKIDGLGDGEPNGGSEDLYPYARDRQRIHFANVHGPVDDDYRARLYSAAKVAEEGMHGYWAGDSLKHVQRKYKRGWVTVGELGDFDKAPRRQLGTHPWS